MPIRRKALIVTALDVERRAVEEHLTGLAADPPHIGNIYRRGIFESTPENWDVYVAEVGAGNATASAQTERAINYCKPEVALFVGIAGGIKDVERGDVVCGTKVYFYMSGKAADTFKLRPEVSLPGYDIFERGKHEAGEAKWQERIVSPNGQTRDRKNNPKAVCGAIASGPQVIASTRNAIYTFIRDNFNDAIAVEMEGRGFLIGVRMNHSVQGLVIRGISDMIEDKTLQNDLVWQPIASAHAAAFAFEILEKYGQHLPRRRKWSIWHALAAVVSAVAAIVLSYLAMNALKSTGDTPHSSAEGDKKVFVPGNAPAPAPGPVKLKLPIEVSDTKKIDSVKVVASATLMDAQGGASLLLRREFTKLAGIGISCGGIHVFLLDDDGSVVQKEESVIPVPNSLSNAPQDFKTVVEVKPRQLDRTSIIAIRVLAYNAVNEAPGLGDSESDLKIELKSFTLKDLPIDKDHNLNGFRLLRIK